MEQFSVFLFALPALIIATVCLVYVVGNDDARTEAIARRKVVLWSLALPGPLLLVLFSSLAVHMHSSLGGWPAVIGNEDFPPFLNLHATVTFYYFTWTFLFLAFVWPGLLLLGMAVRRVRRHLACMLGAGLSFLGCAPLLLLAPDGFLYWWWD